MARIVAYLLSLLSVLSVTGNAITTTSQPPTNNTSFVETSCNSTLYPTVCVQSLLPFATKIQRSLQQMVLVALFMSLYRSKSAELYLLKLKELKDLKPREHQQTVDCWNLLITSIDHIRQSVQELKHLGYEAKDRDFSWYRSNVQTWVSAALTDDTTCLDGLEDKALDGKVKDSIRAKVVKVVQITSNALALVNQFDKTH